MSISRVNRRPAPGLMMAAAALAMFLASVTVLGVSTAPAWASVSCGGVNIDYGGSGSVTVSASNNTDNTEVVYFSAGGGGSFGVSPSEKRLDPQSSWNKSVSISNATASGHVYVRELSGVGETSTTCTVTVNPPRHHNHRRTDHHDHRRTDHHHNASPNHNHHPGPDDDNVYHLDHDLDHDHHAGWSPADLGYRTAKRAHDDGADHHHDDRAANDDCGPGCGRDLDHCRRDHHNGRGCSRTNHR